MKFNAANILYVADSVADEKNIDRENVFEAMENALEKAAKSRYGADKDIRVEIDRATGSVGIVRYMKIVADDEFEDTLMEIPLSRARARNPASELGGFVHEDLPMLEFSRSAAQSARQVILQRVHEAERLRQYEEFKDRESEIITGIIKRVEYGNAMIDIGHAEGVMRRDETIPREQFRRGDRVRCYIYRVSKEVRGPQIFLSRTHPQFMVKLFAQEVPEVYDGLITIKGCARDPGSRAKISVYTSDPSIDPVGACVGIRGSRVQAVVSELQGEKVDIILWSEDIAAYVVNALAPAEVTKVIIDEEAGKIEVVVPEDQLAKAIGRRGQNVRLASILTQVEIDVMTEAEDRRRHEEDIAERVALFVKALDVDDMIARILAIENFTQIEEIAESDLEALSIIEGFDENLAQELKLRARDWVETRNAQWRQQLKEWKTEETLMDMEELDLALLVALGENNVHRLEDLAELDSDELINREDGFLRRFAVDEEGAARLIMQARLQLGWLTQEDYANAMSQYESAPADDEDQVDMTEQVDKIFAPPSADATATMPSPAPDQNS